MPLVSNKKLGLFLYINLKDYRYRNRKALLWHSKCQKPIEHASKDPKNTRSGNRVVRIGACYSTVPGSNPAEAPCNISVQFNNLF